MFQKISKAPGIPTCCLLSKVIIMMCVVKFQHLTLYSGTTQEIQLFLGTKPTRRQCNFEKCKKDYLAVIWKGTQIPCASLFKIIFPHSHSQTISHQNSRLGKVTTMDRQLLYWVHNFLKIRINNSNYFTKKIQVWWSEQVVFIVLLLHYWQLFL